LNSLQIENRSQNIPKNIKKQLLEPKRLTYGILRFAILRIWNFGFRLGLSLLAFFGHEREINGDFKKEII